MYFVKLSEKDFSQPDLDGYGVACLCEDYKNTSKRQNPKSTFQRSALANGGDFDNGIPNVA
jgi:hypothetical protein